MFINKLIAFVVALIVSSGMPPVELVQVSEELEVQQEIVIPVATTTAPVIDNDACYCSRWAKKAGVDIPNANAIDLNASTTPEIGGGILFSYGSGIDKHHIGVIRVFLPDAFFIEEANREPCKVTTRIVPFNDPFIIGFVPKKN